VGSLTPLSFKQRQHLERRLSGVDRVVAFFRAAGVRAELRGDGRLSLDGKRTEPLRRGWPAKEAALNRIIDELAAKYARELLKKAVRENGHFGKSGQAVKPEQWGFVVVQGRVRVAFIRATGADLPNGQVVSGNFLKPGPHWRELRNAIRNASPRPVAGKKRVKAARDLASAEAKAEFATRAAERAAARQAERAAERAAARAAADAAFARATAARAMVAVSLSTGELTAAADGGNAVKEAPSPNPAAAAAQAIPRTPARKRIDKFPDDLAPQLVRLCLDASQRIRLERQVAYDRPVVLESDHGELTLLPVRATGTGLLLPFQLRKASAIIRGELIVGHRDPLPLLIRSDVEDDQAIAVWACALLGFAGATCFKIEVDIPVARPSSPRTRAPGSSPPSGAAIPSLPRTKAWPGYLQPTGQWVLYSGSLVAGHRRRLHDGKTASSDACDRARQVGIILRPDETWVRPHARGIPDGIEMRFRWKAPTELRLSRTAAAPGDIGS